MPKKCTSKQKRIAALARVDGATYEEAAWLAGVHRNTVYRWERGWWRRVVAKNGVFRADAKTRKPARCRALRRVEDAEYHEAAKVAWWEREKRCRAEVRQQMRQQMRPLLSALRSAKEQVSIKAASRILKLCGE